VCWWCGAGLIKGAEYSEVSMEDVYAAKEVFSVGGGDIVPVVSVDGRPIGTGKPGPVFAELDRILANEMETAFIDEIPYDDYKPSLGASVLGSLDFFVRSHLNMSTVLGTAAILGLGYLLGAKRLLK
jgi:hypothetical protein